MSYLSVCMHLHMCVHLGIIQDGKCSGNVKYYNYVQCSFLFLLCSQLGKGNSVWAVSYLIGSICLCFFALWFTALQLKPSRLLKDGTRVCFH